MSNASGAVQDSDLAINAINLAVLGGRVTYELNSPSPTPTTQELTGESQGVKNMARRTTTTGGTLTWLADSGLADDVLGTMAKGLDPDDPPASWFIGDPDVSIGLPFWMNRMAPDESRMDAAVFYGKVSPKPVGDPQGGPRSEQRTQYAMATQRAIKIFDGFLYGVVIALTVVGDNYNGDTGVVGLEADSEDGLYGVAVYPFSAETVDGSTRIKEPIDMPDYGAALINADGTVDIPTASISSRIGYTPDRALVVLVNREDGTLGKGTCPVDFMDVWDTPI